VLNFTISADSYLIFDDWDWLKYRFFNDGRYFPWFVTVIVDGLNLNYTKTQTGQLMVYSLSLINIAIGATILFVAVTRCCVLNKQQKVILFLAVIAIFANPFYGDMFQFAECIFPFSFVFPVTVWAALVATDARRSWLLRFAYSFFLSSLAVMCYQPFSLLFPILFTVFWFCNLTNCNAVSKKGIVESCKQYMCGMGAFALSLLTNVIAISLLSPVSESRRFLLSLVDGIVAVIDIKPLLWANTYGLTVPLLFAFVFVISVCFAYKCYLVYRHTKFMIFAFGASVIIIYALIFIFLFVNYWATPRVLTPFPALPSFVVVMAICAAKSCAQMKYVNGLMTISLLCLIVNYYGSTISLGHGFLHSNERDWYEMTRIVHQIEAHEEQYSITITQVAFSHDLNPAFFYSGVTGAFCLNARVLSREWVWQPFLTHLAAREFEEIPFPVEIEGVSMRCKDWDEFLPEEQILFYGNTAFIFFY